MELVEARLDLAYGVGCECEAHEGRDCSDRVWLAGRLGCGWGLKEWRSEGGKEWSGCS